MVYFNIVSLWLQTDMKTYSLILFLMTYAFLRATVTAIDVEKKLMTLAFINKTYGSAANSALNWVNGEYEIEIEKFNGSIETLDSYQENGQRIIEISGRNNYSKLLSPAVNKNTLHSQDIIYSSNSPFNKLEGV